LDFIRDVVIDVHGRLALEIAMVQDPQTGIGCHPWRTFFADVSDPVGHNGLFPLLGQSGKTIIGALGRPFDPLSGEYYTPASMERVNNFHIYSSVYTQNPHLYHLNGSILLLTDAINPVNFECCVYERADAVAAVAGNSNIYVPDVLADTLVAGAVASLVIQDEYLSQAGLYGAIYQAGIAAIRAGSISMPGLPFMSSKAA
jgi:hypothetical protein